jgi:hypothetical protein
MLVMGVHATGSEAVGEALKPDTRAFGRTTTNQTHSSLLILWDTEGIGPESSRGGSAGHPLAGRWFDPQTSEKQRAREINAGNAAMT